MATSAHRSPYGRSFNPTRRAKQLSHPLDDFLSASESDGEKDNDCDSDFHPGVPLTGHTLGSRGRSTSSATMGHPGVRHTVPILPKVGTTADPVQVIVPGSSPVATSPSTAPPSRRGRKPGSMSRSAREAQRKLNHSIIEKARRTKINEALATLRELVPANYGRLSEEANDDDDEGPADEKGKAKAKGRKKEDKEREFKLEILERTVAFMKDLLDRVKVLEGASQIASTVDSAVVGQKRKRAAESHQDEDDDNYPETPGSASRSRKPRRTSIENCSKMASLRPSSKKAESAGEGRRAAPDSHMTTESAAKRPPLRARLPSISSWLPSFSEEGTHVKGPSINVDPTLRAQDAESVRHDSPTSRGKKGAYLPSPPPSHRFRPTSGTTALPALALGDAYNNRTDGIMDAGSCTSTCNEVDHWTTPGSAPPVVKGDGMVKARTPDEESAASLLLEISLSPTILPTLSSASVHTERLSLSPATSVAGMLDEVGARDNVAMGPSSTEHARLLTRTTFGQCGTQKAQSDRGGSLEGNGGYDQQQTSGYSLDPDDLASRMLKPQTPSMLLGLGGADRVLARAGLGVRGMNG